jgi:hypothetical protein
MLWFERQVVGALMSPTLDASGRAVVEQYVDETLRAMPEHLRLGVIGESCLFGAVPWLRARTGQAPDDMRSRIERWSNSRIDVVRQYVRLLHSLVLFAENELVPEQLPVPT